MKKKIHDEIDLGSFIANIWDQKVKIILITSVFIISGMIYLKSKTDYINVVTNIKPISVFEEHKYLTYNTLVEYNIYETSAQIKKKDDFENLNLENDSQNINNIFNLNQEKNKIPNFISINSDVLLELFINKIQEGEILKKGLKKFKIINENNYENKNIFENEVERLAIMIIDNMSGPLDLEKNINSKKEKNKFWEITYTIKSENKENWKKLLKYVEKEVTEEIRKSLINRFNQDLDISKQISNLLLKKIDLTISNSVEDYKKKINQRLAFLKEQSEIARKLEIKTNALEVLNIETNNAIITGKNNNESYYLKGYLMIEKEIELINSREDLKLYIPNLINLEKEKRLILQNEIFEQIASAFNLTPIKNKNYFKSAKINFEASRYYNNNHSFKVILIVSLILGLTFSLLYVYIYKNYKNKS